MTDRRRRQLTADEIRQRTEAGRKSRTDATEQPSRPGAQDGQVRPLYREGSALVARLNRGPFPEPSPCEIAGGIQLKARGAKR